MLTQEMQLITFVALQINIDFNLRMLWKGLHQLHSTSQSWCKLPNSSDAHSKSIIHIHTPWWARATTTYLYLNF